MSKIKINLTSGGVLEKPLITCFKGTNGNYVVLDNEANGSMGLPIIIISKLNGNNFEKIIDPNEWGAVKDNLKTIIGGTALPYLTVPEEVNAPDDFFTQLTLPVASYDLLKNVYAPVVETPEVAPAQVEAPVATPAPVETPAVPETPATPVVPTPIEVAPIATVATPEVPVAAPTVATPTAPVIEAPVIAPTETPATAEAPAPVAAPVVPEPAPAPVAAPDVPVTPVTAPTAEAPAIDLPVTAPADDATDTTNGAVDPNIALIKDTFMKSCENMFEALIKKFTNKN